MKSSFSNVNNCVDVEEVLESTDETMIGMIAVRHSQALKGTTLYFTKAEWDAFLAGVKAGEFG